MTLPVALAIGLVGGAGAVARFLLDAAVSGRAGRRFPYGTLSVNLLGALGLGVLVGAAVGGSELRIVGTGLIGAFTTFSTWVFESHRLAEDGELGLGVVNLVLSLLLGLLAAWAGRRLGGWL